MSTKAELEAQVEKLRQQLATPPPPKVAVVTLAYDGGSGALLSVAASHVTTADDLRAMKAAVAGLAQQTDMLLLRAVEREARAAATAEP